MGIMEEKMELLSGCRGFRVVSKAPIPVQVLKDELKIVASFLTCALEKRDPK